MRVAFVHEWLKQMAGSESTLAAMHAEFPGADIFAILDVLPASERPPFLAHGVKTSFLQRAPFVSRLHRLFLPLMPFAVEQLDVSGYDVVISNSHAVAKGVITGPDQLHICMCHTPMRYAWDLHDAYLKHSRLRGPMAWLARWALHKIRIWDLRTANGVDHFIANSHYIARRIMKVYRRSATVIYPPVDTIRFELSYKGRQDFYLTASRIVPYKRVRLIVEAFNAMPDRRLVVIGDGPGLAELRRVAGPNVEIRGRQPFEALRTAMQTARAFVYAAEEDFGIVVVEAQACGTPVIGFAKGGACETIVDGVTGVHFHEQTAAAIGDAVLRFEATRTEFHPEVVRSHATRFSAERFRSEFTQFVLGRWSEHQEKIGGVRRPFSVDEDARSNGLARGGAKTPVDSVAPD